MFGRLRALVGRRVSRRPDPVEEVERERRLHESERDHDRFADRVLDDQQHYVTRGGAGGVLPPRGE